MAYKVIKLKINPVTTEGFLNVLGYKVLVGIVQCTTGGWIVPNARVTPTTITREQEAGKYLYKYEKDGEFEIVSGVDHFNHFLKVTQDFLDLEHHKVDKLNESGEKIGDTIITNRVEYKPKHENTTHGLIKLTDANWKILRDTLDTESNSLFGYGVEYGFTNVPLNLVCSNVYDAAIKEGGEFYTQTVEEV